MLHVIKCCFNLIHPFPNAKYHFHALHVCPTNGDTGHGLNEKVLPVLGGAHLSHGSS